jgi:hypothetical protein
VVIVSISVGYLFLLGFLGAVVECLRRAEGSGPLTWMAFGSGLMFTTSLNVALGLVAAAGLLAETSSSEFTYALHTGAFVLAAPVALAGAAFFGAIAVLSFAAGAFPGWLAVLAALVNVGALGGIVSLTGPLNSGNGAVGGVAAPLLALVLWALLASLWMLRRRPGAAGY